MSKDTKAPFHPAMHNGSTLPGSNGLTKREWYAGLAMQGMLSDNNFDFPAEDIARVAFEMADAMLAEGDK